MNIHRHNGSGICNERFNDEMYRICMHVRIPYFGRRAAQHVVAWILPRVLELYRNLVRWAGLAIPPNHGFFESLTRAMNP